MNNKQRWAAVAAVALAFAALVYWSESGIPKTAPPAAAPQPAPAQPRLPGDPCLRAAPDSCPAGCYLGPSSCSGRGDVAACTQDFVCRPRGYDPADESEDLLWLDGRAVRYSAKECYGADPPCPHGCYEGPSRCAGADCSRDRVCRPGGYDPAKAH